MNFLLYLRVTIGVQSTQVTPIVGHDQDNDVAVLWMNVPKDKWIPMAVEIFANLFVGQKVYAIGNQFGLDHTLMTVIISGLSR